MKLVNDESNKWQGWKRLNIEVPNYNITQMRKTTAENPQWVHFGAGNIFRGFIAELQQSLLNKGLAETGIIAAETFDYEIIEKIYLPYDNMTLIVLMHPDGTLEKKLVASVSEGLRANPTFETEWDKLKEIFRSPSLQMASFTITEKGYGLRDLSGDYMAVVKQDMETGPNSPKHAMSITAALAYERFLAGAYPVAFVSMDNCSHNGEKLRSALLEIVGAWGANGLVPKEFAEYIEDEKKVSFPWSMIDKITPRPSEYVRQALEKDGIEDMAPVITDKKTFIAPFVNAEVPQYLVVEDTFTNGRPTLEQAGVCFTDRETVEKAERMKVTTCLNPLHTALAVYGCLLGYDSIAKEMGDTELKKLVEKIGYEEGMPVVVDPGIIHPMDFIREVIELRLPNPFIPDMPQRIATDTSQKVAIRFGETIKAYCSRPDLRPESLLYIPLALAGWLRYLLGVDDKGEPMEISSDPMKKELQNYLEGVRFGEPDSYKGQAEPILKNAALFGTDLYEAGIALKIEGIFKELISGPGAVRKTLKRYLDN